MVEPTCVGFVVSLELRSRGCTAEGQSMFEMEGPARRVQVLLRLCVNLVV